MLRVTPQPPPHDFEARVRTPGETARAAGADPLPDLWRNCLVYLWEAYGRVCSYACVPIHDISGVRSVEHFKPKSKYPELAYDWDNYRLACGKMNSRKKDHEDVLDPFLVGDDWFELDFTDGSIRPAGHLAAADKKKADDTIKRLGLDDRSFRSDRLHVLERLLKRDYSFAVVQSDWPHLAREIVRQGYPIPPPP